MSEHVVLILGGRAFRSVTLVTSYKDGPPLTAEQAARRASDNLSYQNVREITHVAVVAVGEMEHLNIDALGLPR